MREILFRGKRTDTSKWVEGNLVWIKNYAEQPYQCFIISQLSYLEYGEFDEMYQVFPETLGQFTGVTDKDGKRIFEGDIIKSTSDLVNFRGEKIGKKVTKFCEVVVTDDNSSYTYGTREVGEKYISRTIYKENAKQFYEVVGNRFDNPELLTER